jgi:hypothetical protein
LEVVIGAQKLVKFASDAARKNLLGALEKKFGLLIRFHEVLGVDDIVTSGKGAFKDL